MCMQRKQSDQKELRELREQRELREHREQRELKEHACENRENLIENRGNREN